MIARCLAAKLRPSAIIAARSAAGARRNSSAQSASALVWGLEEGKSSSGLARSVGLAPRPSTAARRKSCQAGSSRTRPATAKANAAKALRSGQRWRRGCLIGKGGMAASTTSGANCREYEPIVEEPVTSARLTPKSPKFDGQEPPLEGRSQPQTWSDGCIKGTRRVGGISGRDITRAEASIGAVSEALGSHGASVTPGCVGADLPRLAVVALDRRFGSPIASTESRPPRAHPCEILPPARAAPESRSSPQGNSTDFFRQPREERETSSTRQPKSPSRQGRRWRSWWN
jgi:hypothetical protein